MIVTCEQCATQFQLDDSKVPDGGIRVRCSRCKCAFFVESVRASDADRGRDLAQETLAPDRPADRDTRLPGAENDESDWQFNEEIAPPPEPDIDEDDSVAALASMDDLEAAREAVDDLLGGSFSESIDPVTGSDSGLDLGGSDVESDFSESAGPEYGGIEAAPLPEPDEDPNAVTLGRAIPTEDPGDVGAIDELHDEGLDLGTERDFEASSPDLGRPEDWDFLAEDEETNARSEGSRIGRISPPVLTEAEMLSQMGEPVRHAVDDLEFEADAEGAARAARFARARTTAGWVSVCLLCAHAVVAGLGPRFWASSPESGSWSIAGLDAAGIQGSWIENAVAGPIYVVSGDLRAATSSTTPSGSLLRIRLLDAAGDPIAAESAAVGPRASAEQVREWNPWDLRQVQEDGALRIARMPIIPGERRPFLAVLGGLPPSAAAFEFQAAEAVIPAPGIGDGTDRAYSVDGLGAAGVVD